MSFSHIGPCSSTLPLNFEKSCADYHVLDFDVGGPPLVISSSYLFTPCYSWTFIDSWFRVRCLLIICITSPTAFPLISHSCCCVACLMEHKRDANAAGLAWPKSSTRNSQNPSLPEVANSMASSSNPTPHATSPAPGSLTPSTTGNESVTPSGMYTSDPHPGAPFPEPEHPPPGPHRQGRFTERVVHQIHFKIFTHSNNERELFIEEIPTTGISRTRDPEHFFYGLSGQWEWSKQTSDYWRYHFGLPLYHSNNPFQNNFMENASPSGNRVPQSTIASLATQLLESLSAATASGELGDQWRMVKRLSFPDAIQVLRESSRTSSENDS